MIHLLLLIALVTPTDHPSVHNRCVIEALGGVFMLPLLCIEFSDSIVACVIGLIMGQVFSFSLCIMAFYILMIIKFIFPLFTNFIILICRNNRKKVGPVSVLGRARLRTLQNVYGVGSPTVGTTFLFSSPEHLYAVTCIAEISLIVMLINQSLTHYLNRM